MGVHVEGHRGELRVGYQVAAELGKWKLDLEPTLPRQYAVVADVVATSDYWMAERPLALRLDVGADVWTWRQVEPVIDINRLTVTVAGVPAIMVGQALREDVGA